MRVLTMAVLAALFFAPLAYFGELQVLTFEEPVSNLEWDEAMRPAQQDAETTGSGSSGSGSGGSGSQGSGPSGGSGSEGGSASDDSVRDRNRTTNGTASGGSEGSGGSGSASGDDGGSVGGGSAGSTGSAPQAESPEARPWFTPQYGTGGLQPSMPNFAIGFGAFATMFTIMAMAFTKAFAAFFAAFTNLVWALAWMVFFILSWIGFLVLGAWAGILFGFFFVASIVLLHFGLIGPATTAASMAQVPLQATREIRREFRRHGPKGPRPPRGPL